MSSDTRVIQTRFRYLTFKEVTGLTKFAGFRSRSTVEAERYVNYEDASSWTPANFHPSIYFVLNVFIFLCHRYYSRSSVLFLSLFLFCILRIFLSFFLSLNPYFISPIVPGSHTVDINRADIFHGCAHRGILSNQFLS